MTKQGKTNGHPFTGSQNFQIYSLWSCIPEELNETVKELMIIYFQPYNQKALY
jgi:hypothetical protein